MSRIYCKDQEIYFGFRNLFISPSDQRNVSVTHVSMFSVVTASCQWRTEGGLGGSTPPPSESPKF